MITVVYCTRETKPKHKEHIIKTSGLGKDIEIIEIINHGEGLTKPYNRGLSQAKNDIIVFMHDDVEIETTSWGKKLLKTFEKNSDYGIIGVAGTKNMPSSGRWWDDRNKMYGRVKHTSQGKTWLSAYSEDIANDVEDVIIVDGLFFCVNRKKIKNNFDEEFTGFHFYDISFCFQNFLNGCKLGIITNIRVNHMSIGMTNDEWEDNRQLFIKKYSDKLPITIKRTNFKHKKLKILIGCLSFSNFTGSELHVFELAKALTKNNCDVTICSTLGNPLVSLAKQYSIKVCDMKEPPNFKLGDGKWQLNTPEGLVTSKENTLYKISDERFDIIHSNHKPITEFLLKIYPDIPFISTIHSEVIALEQPVISDNIKKYIAIRPEIKEYLITNFNISPDKIDVIYNPIDINKFKIINNTIKRSKKICLFVGTIDYLRKNTIQDLINTTRDNNEELWIVGKKNDTYLENMIQNESHVKYFEPTYNIEKYVQQCDYTAGILLGRTTIEGWLCGKKGWIYNVDEFGNIKSKTLHDVPEDVKKFGSDSVASDIIEIYKSLL
jgi:glycosyltransferase involved in cell wall biosynthesis